MPRAFWIATVGLLLGWFAVPAVEAQGRTSVKASESVTAVRPVGDFRLWTFTSRQKNFGRLISVVKDTTTVDGRPTVIIDQEFVADYNQLGVERSIARLGEHWIDQVTGAYMGTQATITVNDQEGRLETSRRGGTIAGTFTRGDREVALDKSVPVDRVAWDPNFVDQLELYFALRDINVNDTIIDSIYQPEAQVFAGLRGTVPYFMWQEIYRGKIDSVFIIRLSEPVETQLYFTTDKRLLRCDFTEQNIRVYQDLVTQAGQPGTATGRIPDAGDGDESPSLISQLLAMLPHVVVLVILSALCVAMVAAPGFNQPVSYWGLLLGAVAFLIMPFTQMPLVAWVFQDFVAPGVSRGQSLLGWGILTAAVTALIQEFAKFGAVAIGVTWQRASGREALWFGAFCGAAFGLLEALFMISGSLPLLVSTAMGERLAFVLFHTMSGAVVGFAWGNRRSSIASVVGLLLLVHVVCRYLPVLVREGVTDQNLMLIIFAFTVLVVTVITMLYTQAPKRSAGR